MLIFELSLGALRVGGARPYPWKYKFIYLKFWWLALRSFDGGFVVNCEKRESKDVGRLLLPMTKVLPPPRLHQVRQGGLEWNQPRKRPACVWQSNTCAYHNATLSWLERVFDIKVNYVEKRVTGCALTTITTVDKEAAPVLSSYKAMADDVIPLPVLLLERVKCYHNEQYVVVIFGCKYAGKHFDLFDLESLPGLCNHDSILTASSNALRKHHIPIDVTNHVYFVLSCTGRVIILLIMIK